MTDELARFQIQPEDGLSSPPSSSAVKRGEGGDAADTADYPDAKRLRIQHGSGVASSSSASAAGQEPRLQGPTATWLAGASWGNGHDIKINGPIAYCARCGKYAIERVGVGLTSACTGPEASTKLHVERMREGRHPISGAQLLH